MRTAWYRYSCKRYVPACKLYAVSVISSTSGGMVVRKVTHITAAVINTIDNEGPFVYLFKYVRTCSVEVSFETFSCASANVTSTARPCSEVHA